MFLHHLCASTRIRLLEVSVLYQKKKKICISDAPYKIKNDLTAEIPSVSTTMYGLKSFRSGPQDLGKKKVREKSRECTITNRSPSQTQRGRGNRQIQTSTNRINVRKALRLALSSPSEVIAILD